MNDPLDGDDILQGYSAESSAGSCIRACRNARTLKWLEGVGPDMRRSLRFSYAASLGMPYDEVIWLPEPMDDAALNWVFNRCANWINHP